MKRIYIYLAALFIMALLVAACGHRTGTNPEGVTGGAEDGYGNIGSSSGYGGGTIDQGLLGSWRADYGGGEYEILSFYADGSVHDYYYSPGDPVSEEEGVFYTSGNTITFITGGNFVSGTYSISGNDLTLVVGGDSTVFHRMG